MGPGMMGGYNYCPHCGAYLGGGYGQGRAYGHPQSPECQNFLNQTQGMRKELMDKRFQYSEAMRNPKTTPENASALRKEIDDLRTKIQAKNDQGCWW